MREKSAHQQRVEKFMAGAGHAVLDQPGIPDEATRRLRAGLILEECLETIEALGFDVVMKPADGELDMGPEDKYAVSRGELKIGEQVHEPDLVKIVDGCADVIVVTTGTLSACGVADSSVQNEVDQANLRKFGPGSYRRADGKWMKPPDFVPPDIEAVLAAQAK